MNTSFLDLYEEFKKIKNKGWIRSLRNSDSGIGYTFEKLLGKEEDNFQFPDYKGIEIKTYNHFGRERLTLFCATPDGDFLFPIKRLVDTLGYPDKDFPQFKVFNASAVANQYTWIGYNKKIKLIVDKENQKVSLIGKDKYDRDYNLNISWSFDMIREKLRIKMQYLAVVQAISREYKGEKYFYYNKIGFYQIRDFDRFIDLLTKGVIAIKFKISIFKKGKKLGMMHDRGTSFSILACDIDKLYSDVVLGLPASNHKMNSIYSNSSFVK